MCIVRYRFESIAQPCEKAKLVGRPYSRKLVQTNDVSLAMLRAIREGFQRKAHWVKHHQHPWTRSAHAPRWVKRLPLRVKRTFFKNPFSHGSASTRSECNCTNLWKPATIFLFGRHIVRRKRKQRGGGQKTERRTCPPPFQRHTPLRRHGGGKKGGVFSAR